MRLYKSLLGLLLCLCLCLALFCAPVQAASRPSKPQVTIALDTYDYSAGGIGVYGLVGGMKHPPFEDGEPYYTWDDHNLCARVVSGVKKWELLSISKNEWLSIYDAANDYQKYWVRLTIEVKGQAQVAISNFRVENGMETGILTASECMENGYWAFPFVMFYTGTSTAHLDMVVYQRDMTDQQINSAFEKAKLVCDVTYYPGTCDSFTETVQVSTKNVKRETYYKEGGFKIWIDSCWEISDTAMMADYEESWSHVPKEAREDVLIHPENYGLYVLDGYKEKHMPWNVYEVHKSLVKDEKDVWVESYIGCSESFVSYFGNMLENGTNSFSMEVFVRKAGRNQKEIEDLLKSLVIQAEFCTEFVGDDEGHGFDGVVFSVPVDLSNMQFES